MPQMSISTNSIIHYTNTSNKLKGIIKEGFKIKYCYECLITGGVTYSNAHPLISFCDIPLSDSSRHFGLYGHYGIGISKEWAKKKRINPVLYIDEDSKIAEAIIAAAKEILKDGSKKLFASQDMLFLTKCLAKNYSGPLTRGKT
jgi:Putative abortive phage resistance protein AbiGi, antitoxin